MATATGVVNLTADAAGALRPLNGRDIMSSVVAADRSLILGVGAIGMPMSAS